MLEDSLTWELSDCSKKSLGGQSMHYFGDLVFYHLTSKDMR